MANELPSIPASPLATATFHREGPWLTAVLWGELDSASTPGIALAVDPAITPDARRVRLDLAQVSFCDSSGLAMLFRLRQRSIDEGFDLALVNPTPPVRRILELCDASGVLPIISDLGIASAGPTGLDAPVAAVD